MPLELKQTDKAVAAALNKKVGALEAAVAKLSARIAALESKPAPTGPAKGAN